MKNSNLNDIFIAWAIERETSPGKALVLCDHTGIAAFLAQGTYTKGTRDTLEQAMPEICSKLVEMECTVVKRVVSQSI